MGSNRGNASSTSSKILSGLGANSSTSVSALLTTLLPALVIATFWFCLFLICRRTQQRWYAPRSHLPNLHEQYVSRFGQPFGRSSLTWLTLRPSEKSPELPSGFINWFSAFFKIPDSHVLNHSSLDGYLFLRFLRILASTCFVGCLITWPILLPINVTGGAGNTQLDALSFSNVLNPKRYYAHALVGCFYFGGFRYAWSRHPAKASKAQVRD